jgi:AAA15 family ATPase/GTPase
MLLKLPFTSLIVSAILTILFAFLEKIYHFLLIIHIIQFWYAKRSKLNELTVVTFLKARLSIFRLHGLCGPY